MIVENLQKRLNGKNLEYEKTYTFEEAFSSSLKYFNGDELAAKVWISKYALKNSDGDIFEKNPDDMHRRIAKEIARIEKKYENPMSENEIFDLLKNFKYIIPQGSPMSGIGNKHQVVSLSNCFVIGENNSYDSYGGIMKIDQEQVQLMKRRAGVGHDLSHIRPKGSPVKNSALTSTGVVPFMDRYSNSTREVAQDGRRGALMLSISIKHIDVEDFIDAKLEQNKVTGANISVRIDDNFMKAVINDDFYTQQFPVESKNPKFTKKIKARKLWDKIVNNAWKCVPYDTKIPVYDENNVYSIQKIGDIVTKRKKYHVLSLNLKNLKIEKKPIVDFQEYDNDKNIYQLTTQRNKSITATEDHIVYVLRNEKVIEIPIANVKIGDYLIVANQIRLDEKDFNNEIKLDLSFFEHCSVCFDNFENELNHKGIKNVLGNYDNSSKLSHYISHGKIPINEFFKIQSLIKNIENLKVTRNQQIHDVEFKITNELSAFIGLWLAEGSYHGTEVLFHTHKDEIESYRNLFDIIANKFNTKWSFEIDNNYAKIIFSNSFMLKFMKSIGLNYLNGNKVIPNWVFSTELDKIAFLLKGLFSGDGTNNKGAISFSQSSKTLIEDVKSLLLMFGIHSKISLSEKSGKKIILGKLCNIKDTYRLTIYKESNILFHKYVSFFIAKKQLKKEDLIVKRPSFNIPISEEKRRKLRLFGKNTVSKKVLLEKLESSKTITIEDYIINNDINYDKVISNEKLEDNIKKVYDITVKDNHTFILSNSCVISNSGEPGILLWSTIIRESVSDCYSDLGYKTLSTNPCSELPLPSKSSCRLLAMNLYSYVDNPFTNKSKFNFKLFKKHCHYAQRIMDDIIDLEIEKIDLILDKIEKDPETEEVKMIEKNLWKSIRHKAEEARRTGIGITAEGDMLASLNLTYGDDIAVDFSVEVHKTMAIEVYRSSVNLAKERGSFKIFDHKLEKNNPFILRLKKEDENLYEEMIKYGRRNIAMLTIAPTGTTSLMTQTSSGIEPVFLPFYTRRTKVNPNDKEVKISFTDETGDSWQEHNVFHHKFLDYLKIKNYDIEKIKNYSSEEINEMVKNSPYHNATANDINHLNKVVMQGRIQKWVDHSISATVNLPNDAKKELVSEIYINAWKNSCKGITVYRDGSRNGVLVSDKNNKKKDDKIILPFKKRPKELDAEILRFKNNSEKWISFIALVDKKPYEIFTGIEEDDVFPIPEKIKKGKIIKNIDKNGSKRYDFQYVNRLGYRITIEGLSHQFNKEYWNYAKLISGVLRHGMPLQNVINLISSLNLDGEEINTWKNGVKRALKRYIPDGTLAKNTICENCNSDEVVYQEGCLICKNCGSSKCG